jgi:dipeptidyl aminopeptidase/acylaminoacyl peptidase
MRQQMKPIGISGPEQKLVQTRVTRQWLFIVSVLAIVGIMSACFPRADNAHELHTDIPLPNGSLVFTNNVRIFKIDSAKTVEEPVTVLFASVVGSPVFSPRLSADSKMIFIWVEQHFEDPASPHDFTYYPNGLYLLDTTAVQHPTLLWREHNGTKDLDDLLPSSPQWLADGKQIVFLIGNSDDRGVYLLDSESSVVEPLFECQDYCKSIAVAPTSNRLLLTSIIGKGDDEEGALTLVEEDGTAKVLFQDRRLDWVTTPSWSPDEAQIVFTMQVSEDGWRGVFLLNADGTGLVQVTDDNAYYHSPVWSPNGERLAFVQKSWIGSGGVASRIVLMDLQTREIETLLAAPFELKALQWSR